MARAGIGLQGRKQDFVRGEIWNAAVDLFSRNGYDRTTVEEIADAAGVSRRTFFRYYASKDDLMVKAIDSYGDLLASAIRSATPGAASIEIVRQVVARVAEAVIVQPRVRDNMAISMKSPTARRAQLGELEIVSERIAGEYARALGRRARKAYTAPLMASLTITVLTQAFRTWYERQPPSIGRTVDEILASMIDLLPAGEFSGRRPRSMARATTRPIAPAAIGSTRRSGRDVR
jgi:AcrR family transcriptional regulator